MGGDISYDIRMKLIALPQQNNSRRTIHKLLGLQSQLGTISNMLTQFVAGAHMFELWKVG